MDVNVRSDNREEVSIFELRGVLINKETPNFVFSLKEA